MVPTRMEISLEPLVVVVSVLKVVEVVSVDADAVVSGLLDDSVTVLLVLSVEGLEVENVITDEELVDSRVLPVFVVDF